MNVDAMRFLDRVVGIPACFLLSFLIRLRRLLSAIDTAKPGPKGILFIGLAEIGALVVAHPAIDLARQRFPHADLYFLTFPAGVPMLRLMGFTDDRIITLDPSSVFRLARDTFAALFRIRRAGIDSTVNLEIYVRFSTLLAVMSGARWRVGFHRFHEEGHYLGSLTTHRVIYSAHYHAAQSYMSLVSALAESPDNEPRGKAAVAALPLQRLRLSPTAIDRTAAREKIRIRLPDLTAHDRVVILNANAGDLVAQRRWPLENYVALAKSLLADPSVVIVLTGSATERPRVAELAAKIDGARVVNLAGETSLDELIALFAEAALLITNDSGPAHFASMTDLPTLVLFGPETPRIFGPLGPQQEALYLAYACSPCVSVYNQKRSPCGDNRCLKDISVEMVFAAARRRLAPSA